LYQYLSNSGCDIWLDEKKLLPGQDWDMEIKRAIHDADAVIVILSKNSVDKEGYVQKELKLALDTYEEKPEGAIYLIPALLEECKIPDKLKHLQYSDLSQPDSGKKLLDTIKLRALSIEEKLRTSSSTNLIHASHSKNISSLQNPPEQRKRNTGNKQEIVDFFNFIGIRFFGVLGGCSATFTLRLLSDEYYRPNSSSLLSTIAEVIAHSDFTFVFLVLIAIFGAGFATHYLDDKSLKSIGMPVDLRYLISLLTGYLVGALVDILVVVAVVPLLIVGAVVAGWAFIIWLNSQSGSSGKSQPTSMNIRLPQKESPKNLEVASNNSMYRLIPKDKSASRVKNSKVDLLESPYKPKRSNPPDFLTLWRSKKNSQKQHLVINICFSCNGTGKRVCTTCEGKGANICFVCNGSGRDSLNRKCKRCNGKGNRTCLSCHGSGKQKCSVCNGTGRL
jgi:hypothetical protein